MKKFFRETWQTLREMSVEAYRQTQLEENGAAFALIRIFLAASLLIQLTPLAFSELGHDVVAFAFADDDFGGYRNLRATPGLEFFGGNDPAVLVRLLQISFGGAVLLGLGVFGRLPALVVAVCTGIVFAQNNEVSGGGDLLLGNVLFLILLGDSTHTLSLDAKIRSGKFIDSTPIPAWPRKIALVQLVAVYTSTGFQKLVSQTWLPFDNFSALYQILQSPQWTRFPTLITDAQGWMLVPAWIGTATTIIWECSFPMVLIKRKLRPYYGVVGVGLHIGILVLMEVGIFSWLSLALYPALFSREIGAYFDRRWPAAPTAPVVVTPEASTNVENTTDELAPEEHAVPTGEPEADTSVGRPTQEPAV